jgi:hypothetical protein
MSLDMVEFVMGVEEAFGVRIANDIAATLFTPRCLVDYLYGQLPQSRESRCLSQRAFYRIRRALAERVRVPKSVLRPGVELLTVLPALAARNAWAEVGVLLGYPRWPRVYGGSWLARAFQYRRPRTLDEAARYVSIVTPRAIKPEGEGWSRVEVATVIDGQIRRHFGVREYSPDDRFEDLGWS